MDINAVNRSVEAVASTATTIPPDKTTQDREVVHAIKALNATEMFGQDNELLFQRDQETKRMVVRVINRQTNDVVSQVPAEYVLRLAQGIKGE